ncbi:MAG: GGDEF domain-containing protein [Candidatus Omnitrophica bacterium]|nr:GGDEF domain-containing protein [Candidatus Omnitrophota bacterium]
MKIVLILTLCTITILAFGYVDLLTGPFFHFTIFYLVPIYIASWYVSKRSGVVLLAISAVIWFLNDRFFSYSYAHPVIPYWNLTLRILIFGTFINISSSLKETLGREKALATTDYLTGVLNRRQFFESASRELERCKRYKRPVTAIYIDIDNFKSTNDMHGHKKGDELLSVVGNALRKNTRAIDLIARMGGDEFALILPETDYGGGEIVLGRICDSLQGAVQSKNLPVTFSIGAVTCIQPSCAFDTLIAMADIIMYRAKKEGKNKIKHEIFSGDMQIHETQKDLPLRNDPKQKPS